MIQIKTWFISFTCTKR